MPPADPALAVIEAARRWRKAHLAELAAEGDEDVSPRTYLSRCKKAESAERDLIDALTAYDKETGRGG